MPFWDWHQPLKLRRDSQHLHTEFLLALGRLNVVVAALRNEINSTIEGAGDNDHSGANQS
jgi:hypothetical protein